MKPSQVKLTEEIQEAIANKNEAYLLKLKSVEKRKICGEINKQKIPQIDKKWLEFKTEHKKNKGTSFTYSLLNVKQCNELISLYCQLD